MPVNLKGTYFIEMKYVKKHFIFCLTARLYEEKFNGLQMELSSREWISLGANFIVRPSKKFETWPNPLHVCFLLTAFLFIVVFLFQLYVFSSLAFIFVFFLVFGFFILVIHSVLFQKHWTLYFYVQYVLDCHIIELDALTNFESNSVVTFRGIEQYRVFNRKKVKI